MIIGGKETILPGLPSPCETRVRRVKYLPAGSFRNHSDDDQIGEEDQANNIRKWRCFLPVYERISKQNGASLVYFYREK